MGRERGEGKGRRLAALVSKERKEKEKVVRARFASWLLKPLCLFPPDRWTLTQPFLPGTGSNAVL